MLSAIYRSAKREGMYLFVAHRDDFSAVPTTLLHSFGTPQFVMLFNLAGNKQVKRSNNQEILQQLRQKGFYLQMPPPVENLHSAFLAQQGMEKS